MGGILSGLSPGSLKFFISSVRYNEKEYVCNILILFSLSAGYGKQISGSFFIFAQEVSHATAG